MAVRSAATAFREPKAHLNAEDALAEFQKVR